MPPPPALAWGTLSTLALADGLSFPVTTQRTWGGDSCHLSCPLTRGLHWASCAGAASPWRSRRADRGPWSQGRGSNAGGRAHSTGERPGKTRGRAALGAAHGPPPAQSLLAVQAAGGGVMSTRHSHPHPTPHGPDRGAQSGCSSPVDPPGRAPPRAPRAGPAQEEAQGGRGGRPRCACGWQGLRWPSLARPVQTPSGLSCLCPPGTCLSFSVCSRAWPCAQGLDCRPPTRGCGFGSWSRACAWVAGVIPIPAGAPARGSQSLPLPHMDGSLFLFPPPPPRL